MSQGRLTHSPRRFGGTYSLHSQDMRAVSSSETSVKTDEITPPHNRSRASPPTESQISKSLYTSAHIVRMINSVSIRWAVHAARILETEISYNI
jgi:hypothetical protein